MISANWKIPVVLILVLILSVFFTVPVFPLTELEKKQQELNEIEAAIKKYESLYTNAEKQERKVLGEIRTLEKNIDVLDKDIGSLKNQITTTEEQINLANRDITATQKQIDVRSGYFNERLRQIYQEGQVSSLEVLLKATSFTDFLTRFDLMGKLAENDTKLLKGLETDRKALEMIKLGLEDKVERFNNLKGQKESKQNQMELQSRQKNVLLKSLQEQKEEYEKAMDELEDIRKEIDKMIMELQGKNKMPYMGSGKMGWPLPGYTRVSSLFGYRIHPIFKVRRFHPAIDIPAPRGTPVYASERGRVIYMGYNGGYGRAIILDHGGDISTQYSHLDAYADIKIGDTVSKGQMIGKVGSSGWSTGPHLDFIIRVKGNPENPLIHVSPR